MKFSRSLMILALATAGAAAAAEGAAPATSMFVEKAAQGGMTEVALAKLALDKSSDPKVQQFAQRMVTDHGKANAELSALAGSKGVDAPKMLDSSHQAMVTSMEGKNGAAFDTAYAQHMNMDHSKTITLFESATMSTDKDVAGFARKTLPTLKEHKKMAETLGTKSAE